MPNLKLTDLKWGTLNNIRENDSNASGDRRRTSTNTAIRFATEKAFEINTLTGIKEFNGIVLHSRIVTYASYQNRASLLETFVKASTSEQTENVDFPSFVYKVLLPELDPRPTPLSLDDPVIATYPDIYTDFESETPLEKGQLVAITYEDAENLFNPRITRIIGKPLSIGGCEEIKSTQKSFKKGKPKVLAAPPRRTASSPDDQVDSQGRLVPADADGCSDSRTGMSPPKGILNEPIVRSEIVPNAYGGYIRGKESFVRKVETAYLSMQTQGIDLIIGDSYRSYQVQKNAYMTKGQPGQSKAGDIAHPCRGYHTQGQAIDLAQNSAQKADLLAHGPIYQALYAAGLRRISNEYWHWSVGETDHGRDKVFARNRSGTSPADTFTG